MVRRKNSLPQRLISPSSKPYPHEFFAHRPQTPQRSFQWAAAGTHATPAPKRAHSGTQGERCGETGSPLRSAFESTKICAKRFQIRDGEKPREQNNSRQTVAARQGRVDAVHRRRGPAGLRDPVAVPLTALIGFTILLSRIVAHRKLSACSLVTAVWFLNRCSRRSMRETYPSEQRSGCRF